MLNVELDCQVRNTLFMDEEKTGKTSLQKLFFEIDKRLRIFFRSWGITRKFGYQLR